MRALGLLLLAALGCTPRSAAETPSASSPPSRASAPDTVPKAPTSAPPAAAATTTYPVAETPDEALPDESDEAAPAPAGTVPAHPLDGWSNQQLEEALLNDPASLGPMSIGRPNGGLLLNGVRMPEAEGYELVDPGRAWGTQETLDGLASAIGSVRERFPGSHPLYVGHISAKRGGPLAPHVSHQAGRDVDISYYYTDDSARWYRAANAKNLDAARSWAFVRALIVETDVEMILIDASIQRLLEAHALKIGEDPDWVRSVFHGVPGKLPALIRHAKGHRTHLHIRFYSPLARETARRLYPLLLEHEIIEAPTYFVSHRVKKGETLGKLARRYDTTVRAIQRANGLRSTLIQARKTYRIPKRGGAPPAGPVAVPPRRLPPSAGSAPGRVEVVP